jgi:DNA-binding GntR family transcriptional regulator
MFPILLDPIADLLRESRLASFSGPRMVKLRAGQHQKIFDAIRDGDGAAAAAAMHEHLTDTMKDLERQARRSGAARAGRNPAYGRTSEPTARPETCRLSPPRR